MFFKKKIKNFIYISCNQSRISIPSHMLFQFQDNYNNNIIRIKLLVSIEGYSPAKAHLTILLKECHQKNI